MQTPEQIAARWASGMQGATQKMTDGANSVTVSPGQRAAQQADVWLANTQASLPKFKANTARLTVEDWRQPFLNKGIQRIQLGTQNAQPKVAAFLTNFLPYVQAGQAKLPPRGNFEQNLARSQAMIRHLHDYKRPAGG